MSVFTTGYFSYLTMVGTKVHCHGRLFHQPFYTRRFRSHFFPDPKPAYQTIGWKDMQKSDTEFWNGLLKGLLLAQREIRRKMGEGNADEIPGMNMSLAILQAVKEKIEDVHTSDLERALLIPGNGE